MHCRRCKNKVSQYAKMCPYCHARIRQNERATRQYMEMLKENKITHKNEGSKIGRRMGITLFSTFFAVYLVLISYKNRVNQWQVTDQTVFYMKEDRLVAKDIKTGEMRTISPLSDETAEETAIRAVEGKAFYHDRNGRKVYYAKNIKASEDKYDYSIMESDVYELCLPAKMVAEHVRIHLWDDTGTLYFAKRESRVLYCFDQEGVSQIEIPLVKEIHQVKGVRKLLVIAYEPHTDSSRYDFNTYDRTDREVFYLVEDHGRHVEKLFHNRIEAYAYTSDCRYLYYLLDNQLFEFDLIHKKCRSFEKNIYEFLMVNTAGKDKLYYISYELKGNCLYDYVKDPFAEADKLAAGNRTSLAKGSRQLQEERLSREQFRKQLKKEKIYVFEGTLYQYEDGKKKLISKNISMLDSLYCCMVDHEPFVYKSKPIKMGEYQIKKEGVEDINSVYDMVVNVVDGELRNYDVYYEPLYEYLSDKNNREQREALMCASSMEYKVRDGALVSYDADVFEEEEMRGAYLSVGDKQYYISWYDNYTLYQREKDKAVKIVPFVECYQIAPDGGILTLCYDEGKGKDILYYIDSDLNKQEIDTQVATVLGEKTVSSKQ